MKNLSEEVLVGIICPPFTGHLNPMFSLALEIKKRGYKVVLFHYSSNEYFSRVNQLGLEMIPVCEEQDRRFLSDELETLGKLVGWKANDRTTRIYERLAKINLQYLPTNIKSARCNALLIDQSLIEGESIASLLKLPFINICNALMLNPDINLPPLFMGWKLNSSFFGLIRNFLGYMYIGLRSGKTIKLVKEYRKQNKLPSYPSIFNQGHFYSLWSKIATITQEPNEFEFPRSNLTENFYFTSPFINSELREEITFPWHKLNEKPIVYASLGTLQNSNNIFKKIAEACINLNCQLIISLGKRNNHRQENEYK
jgi:UDP:flavonoid glycosyltransferase YjiC (YdhE family)